MPTIARALFVAALVIVVGCADPGVTTPTTPDTPIGTPQTLTLDASPTTIPAAGGNVHLIAAITVQPGARMPGSISVRLPQAKEPALVPITPAGKLDTYSWVTQAGELVVRAGDLEKHIAITQSAAPPPPESPPPTCGTGGPWPCPPPPAPEPTAPVPMISVSIVAIPATGDLTAPIAFTATAISTNGAPAVTSYDWSFGDGATAPGGTNVMLHTYTTPGSYTASVMARGGTLTGTASTTVTVAPPRITVTVTATPATGDITTPIAFSATAISAHGAPAVTAYDWTFGDGGTLPGGMSASSHTYTTPGSYTVNVTAHGGTVTGAGSTTVTIATPSVAVVLTATPGTGVLGSAECGGVRGVCRVTLSANVTLATGALPVQTYEWDFQGDGTYDDVTTVRTWVDHDYTATGILNPKVRVHTADGLEATATVRLAIASALTR